MPSRNINDLHPELKEKYLLFAQKMEEASIPFIVTCTLRSLTEQMALYVQGRMPVEDVNIFRIAIGFPPIRQENNKIVTWTLNSKHILGKAFDIAIVRENKPVWDIKVDVNQNDIADYIEAGKIGESVGLKWGGRFSNPDYPHFELT